VGAVGERVWASREGGKGRGEKPNSRGRNTKARAPDVGSARGGETGGERGEHEMKGANED